MQRPYFEEAELVLVCRKRFVQPMDPARLPEDVKERWYPQKDYHTLYWGDCGGLSEVRASCDAQRAALRTARLPAVHEERSDTP